MSAKNDIPHEFMGLTLWNHFISTSGASPTEIAMVDSHIKYAMPLLDRYTETFRKYTLHNNWHQKNIIKIMGDLLGPNVTKLTSLECAMLILSAVYHDLGMVYTDNELESISEEPKFQFFLQENVRAMLEFEENDRKPNSNLIEWYCRWMHAERVWVYLNKKNTGMPLKWENASIKQSLGHLCESHNFSVERIIAEQLSFNNQYLGSCDLIFCAILLRLADILDFDNSRSPKSVYEFLDLENPKNKLDEVSKIEWEKHLTSNGFKFNWSKNGKSVKTAFSATTPHPNIEVAIKTFIRSINSELTATNKLQQFCSERWKKHPLPQEVDTKNLTAENYQSGDYHFSLSEDKILNLLTGDGLYNDEFIFIRELLQNAIDTSRHREFYETQTDKSFKVSPIEVSFFNDQCGYQWIRIDDYGMGMNEDIISNHLLKKGESYYNSDKFKLEKIKINKALAKDFVPISRFGIGLLSCFMAGDRIEISTKHISSVIDSYRLGIEGRNSHYVLQSQNKHHDPIFMPSGYSKSEGYRTEYGTSIAVRITTNKEFLGFDIRAELEKYVLCSPVPILYEGSLIGGNYEDLVCKPWADDEVIPIDPEFVSKVEDTFSIKFINGININIENINITEKSLNPNLKGQLIFVAINADYKNSDILRNIGFKLELQEDLFKLKVYSTRKEEVKKEIELQETLDISYILTKFRIPKIFSISPINGESFKIRDKMLLSHNGIVINDSGGKFILDTEALNHKYAKSGHHNYSIIYSGLLYFQDELLPDLSVSRNEIKGLSFELISTLSLALEPLNKYVSDSYLNYNFFKHRRRLDSYTSLEIKSSDFYLKNRDFLDKNIQIYVEDQLCTIASIKLESGDKKQFRYNYYQNSFYDNLKDYILEQNFEITAVFNEEKCINKFLISERKVSFPKSLLDFKPITFVKFENDERLVDGERINIDHPFTQWYIKTTPILDVDYFYYSKQLIYTLFNSNKYLSFENCSKILKRLNTVLPEDFRPNKVFQLNKVDVGID